MDVVGRSAGEGVISRLSRGDVISRLKGGYVTLLCKLLATSFIQLFDAAPHGASNNDVRPYLNTTRGVEKKLSVRGIERCSYARGRDKRKGFT